MVLRIDAKPKAIGSENQDGRGRRVTVIQGYFTDELAGSIDQMVDQDASLITDGLPAYIKAAGQRYHDCWPSARGDNFQKFH